MRDARSEGGSAEPSLERADGGPGRGLAGALRWLASRQTSWVFLAAVVAFALLSVTTHAFATPQNLFNVTRNFAFVGIIACGMTAVIVTGGIDLSVGAVLVLSGMVIGMSMNGGTPFWLAAAMALVVALAVGAVNGFLIAYVGVAPFVVTLGMLSIARSLAMVLSNNRMVYEFGPDQPTLLAVGGGNVAVGAVRIPNPVLFLVAITFVTGFLFRWSRWGRHLFAIGGNEKAAVLTGVRVRRVKLAVYMFSALTAGIAGILEVGWLGTITTSLGQGMELTVIAASVIGGANLTGGVGTALGGVVGAGLIELIRNSLTLLGISTFWQGTFVGCFIIVAVLFDRFRSRVSSE